MGDFWDNFQIFLGIDIPDVIVKILKACGYDNPTQLTGINVQEICEMENFTRDRLSHLLKESSVYSESTSFSFLPGHKKLIMVLGEKVKKYKPPKNIEQAFNFSDASNIMKQLMKSMQENSHVAPTGRRYTEILKDFASYTYMIGGKSTYELLSANLPMPQVPSVCEYTKLNTN